MADNVARFPKQIELRPWPSTQVSDIRERPPPPQWILDGIIRRGTVTLLGGDAKIGKSLLLQQLLSSAAVGIPCLDLHTERCRTYGYFCEDSHDDLINRQFDINAALGIDILDLEEFHWISRAADECLLADFEYGKMSLTPQWDSLWRDIAYNESELLAIDTAAAVFGGNEMNRGQVTKFVRELQQQAITRNMAIILAIHPPTGDVRRGYGGTGAWRASTRAGLSLEYPFDHDPVQDGPTSERILRDLGSNYSARRPLINLRFVDGIFEAVDAAQSPLKRQERTPKTWAILDGEMLEGLDMRRKVGGKIYADPEKVGSLPRSYRKTFGKIWAWNDLYASIERLLSIGKLIRVRVRGECLLRRPEGFPYPDEQPWPLNDI